ncbi:MAG: YbjN domain-containing protein [Treponema sp.]|nr:YbjN domain-containing protein [Treponema sp.]
MSKSTVTGTKIEQYLINMMVTYQELKPNLWLLDDEEHSLQGVAVILSDSLVIIRAEVMDAPRQNQLELYTKLLELNAIDMIHGAYGLENGKIVIIDTLEYDTMDYEEFRATLEAISLALTEHYPILAIFREKDKPETSDPY